MAAHLNDLGVAPHDVREAPNVHIVHGVGQEARCGDQAPVGHQVQEEDAQVPHVAAIAMTRGNTVGRVKVIGHVKVKGEGRTYHIQRLKEATMTGVM